MTLDAIDRAFVARWQSRQPAVPASPAPRNEERLKESSLAADNLGDPELVTRLLAAGGRQWSILADEIEAARLAGQRVIGVAGGERAEGRTTLVACLAHTLRDRGRDVVVLAATTARTACSRDPVDGGRPHDKRIVVVDAGIWFPPGPIRRQRLLMASLGCDAAILVRRADREPAPARAAALAAVGVTVLGEVVTFAPATTGDAA